MALKTIKLPEIRGKWLYAEPPANSCFWLALFDIV